MGVYTPDSNRVVHYTYADMTARQIVRPVHLVQYDQGLPIIAVKLYNDGLEYTIPANATVNIRCGKVDGNFVYNPALGWDSAMHTVYFEVTKQMTALAGEINPIVEIELNNKIVSSGAIAVQIDFNPVQEQSIKSTTEYITGKQYAEQAVDAAARASNSANEAAEYANTASKKADESSSFAANSANSANSANASMLDAKKYADKASSSAASASQSATEAADSADEAEAYAASWKGSLLPQGVVAFSELPTSGLVAGHLYAVKDKFITDGRFEEGEKHQYPAGTCVYWTKENKWKVLSGVLSLELTKAEYDALTDAQKKNGTIYYVKDADNFIEANEINGLAVVAISGNYNDLKNKPSSLPASDVSDWAKAKTKPSYSANEVGLGNVGNFKAVSTVSGQGLSDAEKNNARANIGAQATGSYAASTHTHDDRYYTESETDTKLKEKLSAILKGSANGLAELDSTGKVPASQLPSFVDDVIEGYLYNGKLYKESGHITEISGESGKIYVDLSTEKTYRWSGSTFVVISDTLALGETSTTAYRGDRGKTAYEHSQSAHARTDATKTEASATNGNLKINGNETQVYRHPAGTNPHGTTKADVGLDKVGNFKAVSTVASQGLSDTEKSNARTNIGAQAAGTYLTAHQDISGKLDNTAAGADSLLSKITASWTAAPTDDTNFIRQDTGGKNEFGRVKFSTLLTYIKSKLSKVAASGSYNDLSNKPAIPSVGNGTVTIKQAGTVKGTFTTNQSGNTTVELSDSNTNTWRGIQNNLTSDSTSDSLSAAQGKVLKGLVDSKVTESQNVATDLNNIKSTGIHHISASTSNNPTGTHGTLFAEFNVGTPYQIWLPDNSNTAYKRNYTTSTSSWGNWTQLKFTDTVYSDATQSANGLMSPSDKKKLDGITSGANAVIKVMSATDYSKLTDAQKKNGTIYLVN